MRDVSSAQHVFEILIQLLAGKLLSIICLAIRSIRSVQPWQRSMLIQSSWDEHTNKKGLVMVLGSGWDETLVGASVLSGFNEQGVKHYRASPAESLSRLGCDA